MIKVKSPHWVVGLALLIKATASFGQYTIITPNQGSNLILLNSAFAGNNKCPHVGVNYNYQDNLKPGITSISAEFDSQVRSLEGSVGIVLNKTNSKSIQTLSAEAIYSYSFIIDRNTTLKTAFNFNAIQSDINLTSLNERYTYVNNHTISIPQKSTTNYFCIGGGLLLYKKNNFIGVSFENLNTPNEANLQGEKMKLPIKFSAIGSMALRTRAGFFFPVVSYEGQGRRFHIDTLNKYLIRDIQHISFYLNHSYNKLCSGIGYTYIFNHVPLYNAHIGIKFNKFQINYNLGYSAFKDESKKNSVNILFHQFSAEYTFPCKAKKAKFRTISCPSFGGGDYVSSRGSSFISSSKSDYMSSEHSGYVVSDATIKPSTLTAGEINDFKKWELWKDISKSDLSGFQKTWKITPNERYSVHVVNKSNKPAIDIMVSLYSQCGEIIWKAKTDNTGKAELWYNLLNNDCPAKYIEVENNGTKYTFNEIKEFHESINIFKIPEKCSVPNIVDIAFVVDATGSMSDEIKYLKTELNDVIQKVKEKQLNLNIKINLGCVFYRDNGDSYVTKKSDFSYDISKTTDFIKDQSADGGGDQPEAVDEAIDVAINKMEWSTNAIDRLLFLVLDAPPHEDPTVMENLQKLIYQASEKGIRIIPITGSGIEKKTEYLMRAFALSTNGTYVFLTDHSGVGGTHIIPTTDEYDVEFLNSLMVRLIMQYSSAKSCDDKIIDLSGISDTTIVQIIDHVVVDSLKVKQNQLSDKNNLVNDTIISNLAATDKPNENISNNDSLNTEEKYITIKKSFKFYPNPTNGPVTIETEGDVKDIYLADMNGKLLEHFSLNDQYKLTIDISKYVDGMYFLQYQCNKKWFSGKLLITH